MNTTSRLLRQSTRPTARGVRAALRTALRDRTLDVFYSIPGDAGYLDVDGWPVAASFVDDRGAGGPPAGRWRMTFPAERGEATAVVELASRRWARRRAVEAALAPTALWLCNVALRGGLQAQLARTAAARRQTGEVEAVVRLRLEHKLLADVQRQLADLEQSVAALGHGDDQLTEGPLAELLSEFQAGLRAARQATQEVAGGVEPAELRDRGLLPALCRTAARLGLAVTVDAGDGAGPPEGADPCHSARAAVDPGDPALLRADEVAPSTKRLMYFALTEALTNVAKHAGAARVVIRLRCDESWLTGEVADNGRGGATVRAGGGLDGLAERVHAMDGSLSLHSEPGRGTRLTVRLPLVARPPDGPG
ncbi:sensor histidine kinase [Frankia nepalensis]|uniref:histidine kinase n=2 Tax=Frankia nepalensis TaxID=1836974 RepID=A0A937RH44_9ACTN|nr:ATP-binding protein [Frankia nepalensis]MBL7500409.1 hypothetical protein [Frankia nepalensis]MBL7508707.1 hypothetical protein [Frankia nepalensis]MBL7628870.1 hypothetical protein [Frankia nepalensis]